MIIRKIKLPDVINEIDGICDNEINNNIKVYNPEKKKDDWLYGEGNVICSGFLHGNEIIVPFIESPDEKDEFISLVKEQLARTLNPETQNISWHSFNNQMEIGTFKNLTGYRYQIRDIVVWKGKGWTKDRFYDLFVKKGLENVPKEILDLIAKDDLAGSEIQKAYENKEFERIINHNVADLLKTYYVKKYCILMRAKYFEEEAPELFKAQQEYEKRRY